MSKLPIVERLEKHVFYGDARIANFKQHSPLAMEAATTITELVSALEKAREALDLYGLHLGSCKVTRAKADELLVTECTCGLSEARTALSNTRGDTK